VSRPSVTKKFAALLLAGMTVPAAMFLFNLSAWAFVIYNVIAFGLLFLDYRITPGAEAFIISREDGGAFRRGAVNKMAFAVKNNSNKKIAIDLKDDAPAQFIVAGSDMSRTLPPGAEAEFSYELCPEKRGAFEFGTLHARCRGPLGLCVKHFTVCLPAVIKVFPDMTDVGSHRILLRRNRLLERGRRVAPVAGAGVEFESLREYAAGDDYRKINWPATAREGRPVVNLYETEKNQPVYILIDAGRSMGYSLRGGSKLDCALNAALVLSDIVNHNGDNSGLILFNERVRRVLPPGKGPEHRTAFMEALYGAEASRKTPDYGAAFAALTTRRCRRGLVFIFTDFETPIEAEDLIENLPLIKKRHAPFIVLPVNEGVKALADADARDIQGAYCKGLAAEYLTERGELIKKLSASAPCVETNAERFATEAVNRYIRLYSSRRT